MAHVHRIAPAQIAINAPTERLPFFGYPWPGVLGEDVAPVAVLTDFERASEELGGVGLAEVLGAQEGLIVALAAGGYLLAEDGSLSPLEGDVELSPLER